MNIQSLNNDVLFTIFYINATNEYRGMQERLQTTLSASQVCRTFRDILLNSPSIWGKLVHIDSSDGATSCSMVKEIMQRSSETTPLWIEASQTRARRDSESARTARRRLLLNILRSSWARVERISVISDVEPHGINWDISKIFHRPAPILQVFIASTPLGPEYFYDPEAQPLSLFSQAAPSLRTFGYDGFHLPNASPRYSNITHFDTLDGTKLTRYLNTTLRILRLMPRLRFLRILTDKYDGQFAWRKSREEKESFTVALPHLEYIELSRFGVDRAQEFLSRVEPSPNGCLTNLRLDCGTRHDELLTSTLIPILKKNMQFLYGSAPPSLLCLDIEHLGLRIMDVGTCLSLADCTGRVRIDLDDGIFLDIDWHYVRGHDADYDGMMRRHSEYQAPYYDQIPTLSSFFSSSQLCQVTWLRVTSLYSPCASLLAPFRDVVVLEVHAKAISGLISAISLHEKSGNTRKPEDPSQEEQFNPDDLFPHLRDLRLTVGHDDFYLYGEDIHDFLQYRAPISKAIESVLLVDRNVEAVHGFNYICKRVSHVKGVKLLIRKDGVWHHHVYVPSKATGNEQDNDDTTEDEEGSIAGEADTKDGDMDSDGAAEDANKGSTDA